MKYAEFTVGDLFIKKTVKGYPKSKENLTPVKNGYYDMVKTSSINIISKY